jgi:CheY-like chemotaxis protein/anti-sigma regulatory factor (Ser/Thr protein kinase)
VRVRQVLLNLLSNAIKYTPQGWVRFAAVCKERRDGLVTLEFRVEDSGIGIRAEDMPYLFGDFVRFDESANRHIAGTGLGLSIARNLSRSMGGDITVESEHGQGSVFIITIVQELTDDTPIGPIESWQATPAPEEEETPFIAPSCRVLVVDDVTFNLVVARGLFALYQLDVTTCQSGREAIELAQRHHFDLIFMDHMMPELDGIETTKLLRDLGGWPAKVPIIALTANATKEDVRKCLDAGMDAYCSKPINPQIMIRLIEEWYEKSASRRRNPPSSIK